MIILYAVNKDKLALRLMRCIRLKLLHLYLILHLPLCLDAEKTTQNINTFGIKGPVAPKMWNKFTIHRIIGLMNLDESCST